MNGEPLVPAEVDLRDFMFMPLDVARLRDSELAASQTPECCWAAVLLWAASWHQVPAGSIPDDERWITKTTGYANRGRIADEWSDVREGALHGFVKCADGRLYHPVVAEKALEGWLEKVSQRRASAAGNASKHRVPFDPTPYDDQIAEARRMLSILNPNSKALSKRGGRSGPAPRRPSLDDRPTNPDQPSLPLCGENPPGRSVNGTENSPGRRENQPQTAPKGRDTEGTLKGSEEAGKPANAQAREPAASPPMMPDEEFEAECRHVVTRWDPPKGSFKPMLALVSDREAILAVMREVVASRDKPIGLWKLWAEDVIPERLALRQSRARITPSGAPPPDLVFVAVDTEEWVAWDKYGRANGNPRGYPPHAQEGGLRGWRFPTRWPPGHVDNVVPLERVA